MGMYKIVIFKYVRVFRLYDNVFLKMIMFYENNIYVSIKCFYCFLEKLINYFWNICKIKIILI